MKPDAFDDQLKGTFADPEKKSEAEIVKAENYKIRTFYETSKVDKKDKSRGELVEANKNIALNRSPNHIMVQYENRTPGAFHKDIRAIYDFLCQGFGYKGSDHMIAILHVELIAKGIADPLKFGPSALKAVPQIQEKTHPKEKITAKEKISSERKEEIIERLKTSSYFQGPPPETEP
jgi:hypothetical protein